MKQQVVQFLSEFCSIREDKITLESSIADDLHMEGDDATELFKAFSERFGVDMPSIDLEDYFVSEASFNPFAGLWSYFFGRKKPLKSLHVSDLIAAAETKKWEL